MTPGECLKISFSGYCTAATAVELKRRERVNAFNLVVGLMYILVVADEL